ncbi:patatin family protein [Salimicrobium jeotgali]|uniref:Patatin family protein n=1 Tax=Salimicrobium jeotgali TaxID=1230341 RepID=K2GJT4_9BACI|nr:patatin family protein [Salimicrobium jeotgali]AKG03462.1 patatin family protein [Salimicrobium jeotgali]EKE30699.1 Phospholipase, putative [Salimicrobium jeotgali]MBM7697172.1 putative patatin/cPLA2 family phospholipase [Salimicrobium jeotgali]
MEQTGLVLEGGGSRGIYTAGVLNRLMKAGIYLPYVNGVSAGACNGSSYVARQLDRNRAVLIDYVKHPDYLSLRNLLRKRQLFGMDFLFDTLPNRLEPFDYHTFAQAKEEFEIGTTDCVTGEAVFFDKENYNEHMLTLMRASSSLPMVAPPVPFNNRMLMDGGIADPIPLMRSISRGNRKNVVVLTQVRDYYKKPQSVGWYMKRKYREYPGLLRAMEKRHIVYNETLDYIREEERKGNVFVISPSHAPGVGRVERNKGKLTTLYERGIRDTQELEASLNEFLQ